VSRALNTFAVAFFVAYLGYIFVQHKMDEPDRHWRDRVKDVAAQVGIGTDDMYRPDGDGTGPDVVYCLQIGTGGSAFMDKVLFLQRTQTLTLSWSDREAGMYWVEPLTPANVHIQQPDTDRLEIIGQSWSFSWWADILASGQDQPDQRPWVRLRLTSTDRSIHLATLELRELRVTAWTKRSKGATTRSLGTGQVRVILSD